MTIKVYTPSGSSIDFPDGTNPSVIEQVMRRHFGGGDETPAEDPVFPADGGPRIPKPSAAFAAGDTTPTPVKSRFGDFLKPIAGGHNPIAEVADDIVDPFIPDGKGRSDAEKEWLGSRGIGERVADAASFAASVPFRLVTGGRGGLGDAVEAFGAPEYAERLKQAEGDFVAANRPQMEALAKVGDASMGLPMLPIHGKALAVRPALPGGYTKAGLRSVERIADADAMKRINVEPFGPALTDAGVGSAVEQLSKVPIIGSPIANKLSDVVEQTRDAAGAVAKKFGSEVNAEGGGRAVHQGLDRFFNRSAKDTLGFDSEDLPDDPASIKKLMEVIAKPARETSGKAKAGAMYELAWRLLPVDMKEGRTVADMPRLVGGTSAFRDLLAEIVDRNLGMLNKARATKSAKAKATSLMSPDEVDQLPSAVLPVSGGLLGEVVRDVLKTKNMARTPKSLREMRSRVRRLAAGVSDTERNTMTIADMDGMQSALTDDLVGLLKRNADAYRKNQDHETAGSIERSIGMFRKADGFYRDLKERELALKSLTGAERMEGVAQKLVNAAKSGTKGDMVLMHKVRSIIRDDEWDNFAASIIHELGAPKPSARGMSADTGFSLQSALTNFNSMSPSARRILFRGGKDAERVQALDDLFRTVKNLAQFESLANSSKTTTNAVALGTPIMLGGLSLLASWKMAALSALGAYGVAKFLASPAYVRLLTRAVKLKQKGAKREAVAVQFAKMKQLAVNDPEIGRGVLAMIESMNTDQNGGGN